MPDSTTRPKVVFYDATASDQEHFTRDLSDHFDLVMCPDPLSADNVELAKQADAVSVFVSSAVPKSLIEQMPDLKLIACRSAGFDKVDLGTTTSRGIQVTRVSDYGPETVAEYAFLLLLAISRRLMPSAHAARFGGGTPEKLMGHELSGKTLGIIGTGRIGQHAARLGGGFGMKVIAYDPYRNDQAASEIGFTYVSLSDVISQSDFLSLHAPATPGSAHLLGAQELAQTKKGVLIVNTARGSLIDTVALLAALKSGQVGGAGLDVIESEEMLDHAPQGQEGLAQEIRTLVKELATFPTVLMTRHNAYNSVEAVERIRIQTVANIKAWHTGKSINLVTRD